MKIVITFFSIIFSTISTFSADPLIKFNFNDNSIKTYTLSEINSFQLRNSPDKRYIKLIFNNNNLINIHSTFIDSLTFSLDMINNQLLNIYCKGSKLLYPLSSIQSIEFYNPKNPDVTICNQTWMGANLDVDHYRNGDTIPQVTNLLTWSKLKTGAWCYYNNDPANGPVYGKLYNWYAVNDPRGLAPAGWHIPSDREWKELEICLGMPLTFVDSTGYRPSHQAALLRTKGNREEGTGLWYSPNNGGSNLPGFSALPGSNCDGLGRPFYNLGYFAMWWSSTEIDEKYAWFRHIAFHVIEMYRNYELKTNGYSVRCIKD